MGRQSASANQRRIKVLGTLATDPLTNWKPCRAPSGPWYEAPRKSRESAAAVAMIRRLAEGRRDPLRECRLALWARSRGAARPQLRDQRAFFPVPDRPLRRRQDLVAAADAVVAAAHTRPYQHVRPRHGNAEQGRPRQSATADRHRVPGFPPSRPHEHL